MFDKQIYFSKEEKELLLSIISTKQINMLLENASKYESNDYKTLEKLKVKIGYLPHAIYPYGYSNYEDDGK